MNALRPYSRRRRAAQGAAAGAGLFLFQSGSTVKLCSPAAVCSEGEIQRSLYKKPTKNVWFAVAAPCLNYTGEVRLLEPMWCRSLLHSLQAESVWTRPEKLQQPPPPPFTHSSVQYTKGNLTFNCFICCFKLTSSARRVLVGRCICFCLHCQFLILLVYLCHFTVFVTAESLRTSRPPPTSGCCRLPRSSVSWASRIVEYKYIYFCFEVGFNYLFCYRVPTFWSQAGLLSVCSEKTQVRLFLHHVLPQRT